MNRTDIQAVLCDLDGTITDGMYHVDASGAVAKSFNTRDMHALCRLAESGIAVAVVTGSCDECNSKKFGSLPHKIDLYENVSDKSDFVYSFCAGRGIDPSCCLFIGDGENDIDAMSMCGARACPHDASPHVLEIDDVFVSDRCGGRGAVEEILIHFFA
jgi:hypothetical protein